MPSRRWTRIAAASLVVGGAGYATKYVLLAVADPHGTNHSPLLRPVTVVVLLLGEVLLPIGATAFLAGRLARIGRLAWVLAFILAVALVLASARVLDAAFGALASDPLRLRTEGTLAVQGVTGLVAGLALLRRSRDTGAPGVEEFS